MRTDSPCGNTRVRKYTEHETSRAINALWRLGLFLGGRKDGYHATSFHFRRLIDLRHVFQRLRESIKEFSAAVFVDDITPAELDPRLHFVALLEEFSGMTCLEFEIVCVGVRPEADFFQRDRMLLLLGFLLLLLYLVAVLSEVDDLADRRINARGDFDEVQVEFSREFESLVKGVNSMVSVGVDHAHGQRADSVVDPGSWFARTSRCSLSDWSETVWLNLRSATLRYE